MCHCRAACRETILTETAVNLRHWLFTGLLTVVLLGLLIFQVDLATVRVQIASTPAWVWLGAVLCFCAEGVVSSRRIQICASSETDFLAALKVNGWYVALVLALPARLGEIAAVAVLKNATGLSLGAASMSIVLQRLLDVVGLVLLAVVWLWLGSDQSQIVLVVALLVVVLAIVALVRLHWALNLVAGSWYRVAGRKSWRGSVLKLMLQARRWYLYLPQATYGHAVLLTLLKWLATFSGIALVIYGVASVSPALAITATSLFSLASAIPVHGLGGVGVGEYSLAGVLASQGLSLSIAAGTALLVRGFIIVFGLAFFLGTRLLDATTKTTPVESTHA